MVPKIRFCQNVDTRITINAFVIVANKIQPRAEPRTVPVPPYVLVPPIMAEAMIVSSVPVPAPGCADANRDARRTPASAAHTEVATNTLIRFARTLIPAR